MIWRAMQLCYPSDKLLRAMQMHFVNERSGIADAEILDAKAVMSTTLTRIHRLRLNPLTRMRLPTDLASPSRHAYSTTTTTRPGIILTPLSTTSIDNVQFCLFCLASHHSTPHCPFISPQLCKRLISTREANLSPIARHPRWYRSNPHPGESSPRHGSTPTTQC